MFASYASIGFCINLFVRQVQKEAICLKNKLALLYSGVTNVENVCGVYRNKACSVPNVAITVIVCACLTMSLFAQGDEYEEDWNVMQMVRPLAWLKLLSHCNMFQFIH